MPVKMVKQYKAYKKEQAQRGNDKLINACRVYTGRDAKVYPAPDCFSSEYIISVFIQRIYALCGKLKRKQALWFFKIYA